MKRAQGHQRGYVFRKGNAWYLRYRESVVQQDGTSKLKQRCRKLADFGGEYRSKKAVRAMADEFLAPFNNGTFTIMSGMTIEDFVESIYFPVKENKKPSTYEGYRKMWTRYLKSESKIPLRDFRTFHCESLLTKISREYQLGIRTVSHIKNLMSGIFRYALRTGVLNGTNPVRDACLPKSEAPTETYAYNTREITEMIQILPYPAKAVVATAAYTGLRKGELRGLHTTDYFDGVFNVRRSIWKRHIGAPQGKRGVGAVPVIGFLATVLEEYRQLFETTTYLFQNEKGGPVNLDYMSREIIIPTLTSAKLEWHGWHALRRGLATNLHEIGVDDIVIQAILRHSSVEVTRESYIKRDAVDQRSMAAMKALELFVCNQSATDASVRTIPIVVQ